MTGFPIADAHQHFWDPRANYLPWLCDPEPIAFRYGDYSALKRPYLPEDYFADARGFGVVKTVYVEAEWDPRDPIGETRWVHATAARDGLPHAMVAQAWLDRPDAAQVLAEQAAFPLVRSVRHKPKSAARPLDSKRGAPGSMDCPRWRDGFALLAGHRLHFDLQTPWWHLDAAAEQLLTVLDNLNGYLGAVDNDVFDSLPNAFDMLFGGFGSDWDSDSDPFGDPTEEPACLDEPTDCPQPSTAPSTTAKGF